MPRTRHRTRPCSTRRAISVQYVLSQRHIRVTHNPWVACSSPARPTVGSSPPSPSYGGVPPIVPRAVIPADTSTSSRRTPGSQVDSSMLSASVGSIRKLASGRHQGVPNGPDPMRHVARQLSRPRWTPRAGCTKSASRSRPTSGPPKHRAEKARALATTPDLETYAKWRRLLALAGLSQRDSVPPGR